MVKTIFQIFWKRKKRSENGDKKIATESPNTGYPSIDQELQQSNENLIFEKNKQIETKEGTDEIEIEKNT